MYYVERLTFKKRGEVTKYFHNVQDLSFFALKNLRYNV